jgi:hypothetical protein
MSELAWLVGYRFHALTRREFDWVLEFDKDVSLVVACLWRLVEGGRIRFTSLDDGQQFGLPASVDAAAEVNRRLAQASVEGRNFGMAFSTWTFNSAQDTFFRLFRIHPGMRRGTCAAEADSSLRLVGVS